MEPPETEVRASSALIVSALGSLSGISSSELDEINVRCILAQPGASVKETISAAALQAEETSIFCLVATWPATEESLALERALRFLAAERGQPLTVLRIDSGEPPCSLARTISVVAVSLAGCGVRQ